MNLAISLLSLLVIITGLIFILYKFKKFTKQFDSVYKNALIAKTAEGVDPILLTQSQPSQKYEFEPRLEQYKSLVIKIEMNPDESDYLDFFKGTIYTNDMKKVLLQIKETTPNRVRELAQMLISENPALEATRGA